MLPRFDRIVDRILSPADYSVLLFVSWLRLRDAGTMGRAKVMQFDARINIYSDAEPTIAKLYVHSRHFVQYLTSI